MSRRIRKPERIILDIAVPVQALGIARLRHDRICADEPPDDRIIVPGVVEIQPAGHTIQRLSGEAPLRRRRAKAVAALAPRLVANLRDARARLIGRHRRAAEVIGRQPAHRAVDPQRNPLTAGDIGFH